MSKPLELEGQKFGHLIVIKQMANEKGITFWLCQCSCGQKKNISGRRLNFGNIKSCGCVHGLSAREYIKSKVEVDPITGCWLWKGSTSRGYGRAKINGEIWSSHRLSYSVFISPIPKNKIVCHNCPKEDRPLCCNPEHLWLGNNASNSNDMVKKGRSLKGEKNNQAKITENDVIEIKRMLLEGISSIQICKKLRLSTHIVSKIKRNKTWRHVN